jgi:cell fate (sporulation/competence/biofilm development) regulator YlbF (YheA/YmcA/DUF963 family)
MNVYDEAHSLARAIKESNEFKEFDRMRIQIEGDEDVSKMLGEMQQLQVELQAAQMQGKQPDPSTLSRVQSLSTMLATKPLAAQFMQAEAAFSLMMNDVFAIIGEAMGMK